MAHDISVQDLTIDDHGIRETYRVQPPSAALAREALEEQWRGQVSQIVQTSMRLCEISEDHRELDAAMLRAALAKVADERLRLRELEAALERLDAGRYGCCEQCGGKIRPERLEVLPETRYCASCQPRSAEAPSAAATNGRLE